MSGRDSVQVNTEALKKFTRDLQSYIRSLEEETGTFRRNFAQVSETWRDGKHAEFEEVFNEMQSSMKRFTQKAEELVPGMKKLEEHASNYLNIRF